MNGRDIIIVINCFLLGIVVSRSCENWDKPFAWHIYGDMSHHTIWLYLAVFLLLGVLSCRLFRRSASKQPIEKD